VTVREVLNIGHPVLRQRATEVPVDQVSSPQTQQLIDDLIDTMHHAHGAGPKKKSPSKAYRPASAG